MQINQVYYPSNINRSWIIISTSNFEIVFINFIIGLLHKKIETNLYIEGGDIKYKINKSFKQ
jgi:hypothetical protein